MKIDIKGHIDRQSLYASKNIVTLIAERKADGPDAWYQVRTGLTRLLGWEAAGRCELLTVKRRARMR